MVKFPENFYFGSATSSTQSEGAHSIDGKGKDIWDLWYEEEPFKFHDEIGPENTSTFYKNYKSDIQLLKKTGHNSFRTSISWSRMFPEGYGEVNEKAVAFYRDVFEKAHLVLNEKAFLAFEMGWDQGESLSNLAREYFESATITVHKDMSGKDRMLTIEL